MFNAIPARLGPYIYGRHLRHFFTATLLILLISASALKIQLLAEAAPQELDPRVPYDSLNIIKLNLNVQVYQRSNELPEKVYYDFVEVGQPPRATRAIYDTSTSEVWYPKWTWNPFARNLVYLMGHSCSQSVTCTGPASKDYEIVYRGTRLSGEAYSDQLVLGSDMINYHYNTDDLLPIETKTGKITLKQRFLAIYSASDDEQKIDQFYPYMILGLAPAADALVSGSTTLLSNMQRPKDLTANNKTTPNTEVASSATGFIEKRAHGTLIDKELFSFWFQPLGEKAEIIFGGTDNRRFSGPINYHPLIDGAAKWQLSGSQLWLGRRLLSKPQGYTISMDTGVNDLYGPKEIVDELYKELNATQYENNNSIYLVNCHTAPNLPDLSFQFSEDASLNLPPRYYIRTMNMATNSFNFMRETCYVSIMPHKQGRNDWTLGTHFMEAYYTVFDYTNRRVGFATSKA